MTLSSPRVYRGNDTHTSTDRNIHLLGLRASSESGPPKSHRRGGVRTVAHGLVVAHGGVL